MPDTNTTLDRLVRGWRGGRLDSDGLEGALSLDEGLAMQLQLLERLESDGEQLGGWKVGLTSGTALDRMGPGFRPFGFLLRSRILESGGQVALGPAGPDFAEGEVCFRVGQTIRGEDVTPDDARRTMTGVVAGLELNVRGRYPGNDGGLRIADNMTNWGIVIGDEVSPIPGDFDFEGLEVRLGQDGETVGTQPAKGHIDDHFLSLSRLVQQLARFGRGLEAGQHVITGAFVRTPLEGPTAISAEFSGIGRVGIKVV